MNIPMERDVKNHDGKVHQANDPNHPADTIKIPEYVCEDISSTNNIPSRAPGSTSNLLESMTEVGASATNVTDNVANDLGSSSDFHENIRTDQGVEFAATLPDALPKDLIDNEEDQVENEYDPLTQNWKEEEEQKRDSVAALYTLLDVAPRFVVFVINLNIKNPNIA